MTIILTPADSHQLIKKMGWRALVQQGLVALQRYCTSTVTLAAKQYQHDEQQWACIHGPAGRVWRALDCRWAMATFETQDVSFMLELALWQDMLSAMQLCLRLQKSACQWHRIIVQRFDTLAWWTLPVLVHALGIDRLVLCQAPDVTYSILPWHSLESQLPVSVHCVMSATAEVILPTDLVLATQTQILHDAALHIVPASEQGNKLQSDQLWVQGESDYMHDYAWIAYLQKCAQHHQCGHHVPMHHTPSPVVVV